MLAVLRNCDWYECIRARGPLTSQREKWLGEQEWRLTKRKKKNKGSNNRATSRKQEKFAKCRRQPVLLCAARSHAHSFSQSWRKSISSSSSSSSFLLLFNERSKLIFFVTWDSFINGPSGWWHFQWPAGRLIGIRYRECIRSNLRCTVSASAFISTCKVNDLLPNSTLSSPKFAARAHKFYAHRTGILYKN